MSTVATTELILIRHGPTDRPGYLCGRTDVGLAETPALPLNSPLADITDIRVSPARRARQTAQGLWPNQSVTENALLWEQDFGDWDGKAFSALPDIGTLSRTQLTTHRPPKGESFQDVVTRVQQFLAEGNFSQEKLPPSDDVVGATRRVAIVAHAGIIRAALAIATNNTPGALAFEIDHLSVTRLRRIDAKTFSVIAVNEVLR